MELCMHHTHSRGTMDSLPRMACHLLTAPAPAHRSHDGCMIATQLSQFYALMTTEPPAPVCEHGLCTWHMHHGWPPRCTTP